MREVINHHVVREWMEYKSHHHIYESRTFSKRPTWCKLMITLIRRLLVESSHELIIGHSPQTLTTRIVRKLYLRNPKHIRNKLRCDRNARTSNASKEERYWTINPMHVGVKLLDEHERASDRDMTNVNRRRGRERKTIRKVPSNSNITSILKREYICMGNAWTCDMQNKLHHGLSPIQTYQHTNRLHTSKCMKILL